MIATIFPSEPGLENSCLRSRAPYLDSHEGQDDRQEEWLVHVESVFRREPAAVLVVFSNSSASIVCGTDRDFLGVFLVASTGRVRDGSEGT